MELKSYLDKLSNAGVSRIQFAKELGVFPVQIHHWETKARPVPAVRAVQIEKATNGEVTRADLRPDDWEQIWPELKKVVM